MIRFVTPYSTERDIGISYNREVALTAHPDDWICMVDGDAMFTVRAFGHKIQEIIDANPEYSTFTCMTNRVLTPYQRLAEHWWIESMAEHWDIGEARWDLFHTKVKDLTTEQPFSGVMILTQKKTWQAVGGFREGDGMLGIDNNYHKDCVKAGFKVGLMQGIYLMHYYRNGDPKDKAHLL